MLLACVYLAHLPALVELERYPQLRGWPLVIVEPGSRIVLDASPRAIGVTPGMPLSEAQSRGKLPVYRGADPGLYQRVFEKVLDGIESLAADVEDAGLGLAYVRLDNLFSLFGDLPGVADALLHAVPASLYPRIGVAPGKFPALVVATQAAPRAVRTAPEDLRGFLAPQPVEVLPVGWRVRERLRSFGLQTLGQVAALSVGALQAQFGPAGRLVWELSQGLDPSPFVPRRREEKVEETLAFMDPLESLEGIGTAMEVLLGRAFGRPGMRGRYARSCTLEGSVFRATPWRRRVAYQRPLGDAQRALPLLKRTVESHPPSGPLEDLRLTLSGLTGEGGRQESFLSDVRQRENLREALLQLEARLGTQPPIYQLREVEPWSRMPERRLALVPYVP